jgi:uncharacterized protein (TIGR00730 family)
MNSICVFCGAHAGRSVRYAEAARALGRALAERSIHLVYGAGHVGLMGILADATLEAGGEVTGVIPRFLVEREIAHRGLTNLEIVETMHDRKSTMAMLSEAFIGLPGGLGTLEELFEVWTWGQLGLHRHPLGLLEVDGYFAHLTSFLDHAVDESFIRLQHRAILAVESDPHILINKLMEYTPPPPRLMEGL